MELVTPVITTVVESLMGVVKRHLGYLVSSTNNVTDMRARMEQLNNTARDIKKRKEMNDANNLVVPHHVSFWLAQVDTICEEAGSVPTGGIGCFNMKTRYKAGKQSSDILRKIDNLERQESNIKWSDEQQPLGRVPSTLGSTFEPVTVAAANDDDDGTQTGFKSRDLIFKKAMKALDSNNKIQKIALCGMGGVGKTTMMDQLKKVAEDKKMFDWIVKVVIGKSDSLIAVQQTIAEYIGQPLIETQKDTRAERLRKKIVGMSENGKKNILVILDDLWEELDLEDIGLTNPLPKGFKLLLTSRQENVCTRMGVEASSIFRIAVLEETEAKKLFWEIAGTVSDGNIDHDLRKIGEDIVRKCGGLPIAIKIIASSLKDNNIKDEWEDALSRLQNKKFPFLDEIYKISYDNLKDDDEKATLLLSGLFPDNYNIPTEDLMRYGWGLKFFQNVGSITTARRRVNTCVNNLIRSNMLIESDRKGCVKMHDLMRDFILFNFSIFKQASLVNSDDISEQLTEESYERILLKCTGMREFPADFNHPNLALLKLLDGDKLRTFPKDFYDRMKKLEVVAYDGIRQQLLPRYSTTLRTLCLRSCRSVGDISFIGDLVNLEVLSFAFCGISKLPSAIGNLKKLKLLDLTGCVDLCINDGVFHKLEKLRELYMIAYEGKPIRFTEDSCEGLKMLSSKLIALDVEFFQSIIQPKSLSFEKLERFRISMGCPLNYFDYNVYENTLKLVVSCKELLECKINVLFRKTEKLDLSVNEMSSLEQISMHPSQHSFCNLRVLYVYECADLTSIFTFSTLESLTKLEEISISRCKVMKVIVREENGEQTVASKAVVFPRLKSIILSYLPNLEGFFLGMSEFKWPLLDDVKMIRCPKMMAFTSCKSTTPKLKYIHSTFRTYSPEFYNFYVTTNSPQTPSLSLENGLLSLHDTIEVNVEDNDEIEEIFEFNELLQLPNLEKIHAKRCKRVKKVFEVESEVTDSELNSKSQTVVKFPKLREVDLENLYHLEYIWKSNIQGMKLEFPNLTRLSIHNCYDLKYVFTSSMVGSLMQLQDLHITNCYSMEVIVKDEENTEEECDGDAKVSEIIVFPCLKSLKLDRLRWHFKGFYLGKEVDVALPSLNTLVIKRCRYLETFNKGRVAAPQLKVIETGVGLIDVGEQDINSFIITQKQEEGLSFGLEPFDYFVEKSSDDEEY